MVFCAKSKVIHCFFRVGVTCYFILHLCIHIILFRIRKSHKNALYLRAKLKFLFELMLQVRSSRQDISAALSSSVDVTEPVDHMDTTFDMVCIYCTKCSLVGR